MKARIRPVMNIRADFVAGTARGSGNVDDLSADGLFLRTPLLPQPGPIAIVLFPPEGGEIHVAGLVRWNSGRSRLRAPGFGVRLTASGSDYAALLDRARSRALPPAARSR